jgi:hypothetical protein
LLVNSVSPAAAAVLASLVLLLVNPVSAAAAAAVPAISVFNACEMDTKQNEQALLKNQVLLWEFMSMEPNMEHGSFHHQISNVIGVKNCARFCFKC